MNNSKGSDWRRLLDEVMTESDITRLQLKTENLETALYTRCQEMHSDGGTDAERKGLTDATQKLLRVRVEKLGFPMDEKLLSGTGSANESQ